MLFLKKTLPEWHPRKTFHYIILQNPPRWFYLHLSEHIPPPKKKKKSHSTFFLLNCMTSSIQVTKRGKKTCILKRRIAQSSFIMYIYANSTLVYSRKSLSLLLSLPPGQCFNPAVCMKSGGRQGWWIMNGLKQTSTKRKKCRSFTDLQWPPLKFKIKQYKILQSSICRSTSFLSPLINSGCLLIRWTVYSICSLSSCSDSIRLYLIAYFLHINNLILPPTPRPSPLHCSCQTFSFNIFFLFVFLIFPFQLSPLHSSVSNTLCPVPFSSSIISFPSVSSFFLIPTLFLSAAPSPPAPCRRLKYEETIKLWLISIWTGGRQATADTTTEPWKSTAELFFFFF